MSFSCQMLSLSPKVRAVEDAPEPRRVAEFRSLLGWLAINSQAINTCSHIKAR